MSSRQSGFERIRGVWPATGERVDNYQDYVDIIGYLSSLPVNDTGGQTEFSGVGVNALIDFQTAHTEFHERYRDETTREGTIANLDMNPPVGMITLLAEIDT